MKKIIHTFGIISIFLLNIISVYSADISNKGEKIEIIPNDELINTENNNSGSGEIVEIILDPSNIQIDSSTNIPLGKVKNNILMKSTNNFLENGLISKWSFDNCNANDSVGDNHGESYGNISCQIGKNGNALKFGGVGNPGYIIIPNNTSISMIDNFTYNITFKLSSYTGMNGYGNSVSVNSNQTLLAKGGDRSGLNIFIGTNAFSEAKIYLFNGRCCSSSGKNINSDIEITPNKWYTLSVSSGGGYIKFYLDGILEKTMPTSEFNINTNMANQPLKFGISESNFRYPLNGLIDEVSIYNRALNSEEIANFFGNNSTSSNSPIYTYNPLFVDQNKIYSLFDKSTNACNVNESLKQTNTTTSQADLGNKGDPVNLATGEFDYENTFLSIPGEKIPYDFTLNYKNQTYYNGPVGINWDHNYNKYLIKENNGNILYYNGKLGVFRFLKNSSNTYDYNLGIKSNLVYSGGLFEIHYDSGKKEYFNSSLKLSQIQDIYENELNFSYDSNNLLSQVTDTLGRNIDYTYENNRLTEVKDFHNNSVEIVYYDGNSNSGSLYDIQKITLNNNENTKTISFEYDNNHNITKLIDSKEQNYVTNTYDTNKRVTTQIYGTGTISYNYTLLGNQVIKNTVTDKVGNITEYIYDNSGNNIQTIYKNMPEDIIYNYTYNSEGYLTSEIKPLGNGVKYVYDNKGNIIEKRQKTNMSAHDNNTSDIVTSYTYNSKNQLLTQTLPSGVVIENTYDTNGNLIGKETSNIKTSALIPYSISSTFSYDSLGQLIESTDARGNKIYFTYSSGMLIESKNGTGITAILNQFTYNDYGILTSKTDGRGNTTTFEINDFHQTGTGITSEGIVKNFLYDENNNITTESHYFTGGVKQTQTVYDILDNPTQIISNYDTGKQVITHIKYDNNGNITEKQTGNGAKIKYTYNNFGKVIQERIIVDSNDSSKDIVTGYGYDSNGNIFTKLFPVANIEHYQYDLFDRLTKKSTLDGSYTTFSYNKDNSIAKEEKYNSGNILLSKKEFTYNGVGKIIQERSYKDPANNSLNTVIHSDYDQNGNLISQIDALWKTTTFEYDTFNRLIKTTDTLGNKLLNTYDKNNNIISKSVEQNNGKVTIISYTYDNDNRLITETNHLNKSKYYTYNNLNQITSITDEQGNITALTYDYLGNILTETKLSSSGNIITTYTYDERGNMTSITDGEGNTTNYIYNNLNQLITTKYADNKEINYSYDKAGNITSQTDPNGTIVNYIYDILNRISSKTIVPLNGVGGVTSESYTYDSLGRIIEANDSNNHKLEFEYDSLNRLISETQSGSIVSYTYDDNNNLLSITPPSGKTTSYTYDDLSRVLNVGFSGSTFANYSYTGVLNDSLSYGNGKVVSQTFDGLNRISSLNNGIKSYSYSYDDISNIVSDSLKNYSFDDFSRLTQVHETLSGTLLETFGFDKVGNRMSDISENEYDVNILNQYTSLSGSLNVNFTYDNNGNLISDGEKIFSYDYKNRLIKVENAPGIIAEFAYDILGRRYEKKTNSETISYIYADKNIVSETTLLGENSFTKHYVNGLGIDNVLGVIQDESDLSFEELGELNFCNARILTYSASFVQYGWSNIVTRCEDLSNGGNELITNTYYFHKNHLGSIIGITDVSGDVVSEYEYDSFGNFTLIGSDIGNARLFTGREFDFEIGLYYNRARYYSSELGRFISRDPIGQIDDVNLYSYVSNNPVMFSDPNGETKQLIAGATLGDYNENGNGWSTTGQILTGFVPYYGQVADVRDFSYQWENGTKTDIAFAGIAFIPGIGDGAKALKNSGAIQKGLKDIKSLEKQIELHLEKLKNYKLDPDQYDNKNFLKNAGENIELRNKIINSRIKHLNDEILEFKKQIENFKNNF